MALRRKTKVEAAPAPQERVRSRRRPLTSREATHSRDGRPYVRDERGTIRKGDRNAA